MTPLITSSRVVQIAVLLLIATVVAGCWDREEIDNRDFVLSTGIDLAGPEDVGTDLGTSTSPDGEPISSSDRKLRYTIEFPIWRALAQQQSGGDGSSGQRFTKPAQVISSTATTVFEAGRLMSLRVHRRIFFGHMDLLAISEEVAREEGIAQVVDVFERDPELTRRFVVAITDGEARELLLLAPKEESFVGTYVKGIIERREKSSRMVNGDFNRLLISLHGNKSAVLPMVRVAEDEVVMGGAAVIKDYKMVGKLAELETRGLLFIQNRVRGGSVVLSDPEKPWGDLVFQIGSSQTRVSPELRDGEIVFRIDISVEGILNEQRTLNILWDEPLIEQVEQAVSGRIDHEVRRALEVLQNVLQADVMGFGESLHRNLPDVWNHVSQDWEETYLPGVKAEITVKSNVRRIGLIR